MQRFTRDADCGEAGAACNYTATNGWPALDVPGLDPLSIAVSGDHVYVGHQVPSIWVLERESGHVQTMLGEGAFERPHGLFVADDGTLWVADDHGNKVVHLDADGHVIGTLGEP